MHIYLGGSRNLQAPSHTVTQAVTAMLSEGHTIHVGCCVGADQLVIASALALRSSSFQQLQVFAAFGPKGEGSSSFSSVGLVQAAAGFGIPVQWWAGGPVEVPLTARLIRRSITALQGCSAALFFEPGTGSLAVAAQAAQSGIAIYAITRSLRPILHTAGQWQPAKFIGSPCLQWQPAQQELF